MMKKMGSKLEKRRLIKKNNGNRNEMCDGKNSKTKEKKCKGKGNEKNHNEKKMEKLRKRKEKRE